MRRVRLTYEPSIRKCAFRAQVNSKSLDQTAMLHTLGPVVQSIVSSTSSLMTNWLTAVAKVFSNMLLFLLQKCE